MASLPEEAGEDLVGAKQNRMLNVTALAGTRCGQRDHLTVGRAGDRVRLVRKG